MNENELKNFIALAEDGDMYAINMLASYYCGTNMQYPREIDVDEALKWCTIGAEKGNKVCMALAAHVGHIKAHALRCIYGNPDYSEIIDILNRAVFWAKKALENGLSDLSVNDIQGELGIAYYLFGLQDASKPNELLLEKAIDILKACYQKTTNYEDSIYLGFAIIDYVAYCNKVIKDDEILAHSLLTDCVNHHFKEYKLSAVAARYLGIMYTEGVGCSKDYDMAVYYLQKAHDAGHDCSDLLCRFKKTLFGGYKFI